MASNQDVTTIIIADDHTVVRSGLRALLERHPTLEVIGEAANGREAVRLAQELTPDMIVMDVNMPDMTGIEACERVMETVEGCQVIILTTYVDDELLFKAVQAGAGAYVLKRSGNDKLVDTIERLNRGETILDPTEVMRRFDDIRQERHADLESPFTDLTQREITVLYLISQGMTNSEIAQELNLAQGTIRNYVSNVLGKLDVTNRAEAAAYAARHHITDVVAPRYDDD